MPEGCVRDRRAFLNSVWREKKAQVYSVCSEGHGSDSLSIIITFPSWFMMYEETYLTNSLTESVRAWLTAYLIIVMLSTTAQAAFSLPARGQIQLNLIEHFVSLY